MYRRLQEDPNANSTMDRPLKPAPPPPYNDFRPECGPVPTAVPAPAPAPTIVSVTNVGMETSQPVGPQPVIMTCPQCRCRNKTKVTRRATARTHLACLLLSWTLCCCFFPYCMDSCRNVDHFCPTCEAFVGSYSS